MTVSRPPVKFKRMYELISSCRWKLSVPSGRPSYVGSIERPYDLDVRPDRVPERMEAAMSASTWAPARQLTDDAADIRPPIAIPSGGRTTPAGRRARGGVKARERFAAAHRPTLRLVPPLADSADWTADTTATLKDGTAGDPAAEATRSEPALAGPDSVVSPDAGMPVPPVVTPSMSRQSVDTRPVIARLPVGPADSSARARSPRRAVASGAVGPRAVGSPAHSAYPPWSRCPRCHAARLRGGHGRGARDQRASRLTVEPASRSRGPLGRHALVDCCSGASARISRPKRCSRSSG